jgi:hypothetical protein
VKLEVDFYEAFKYMKTLFFKKKQKKKQKNSIFCGNGQMDVTHTVLLFFKYEIEGLTFDFHLSSV